MLREALGKFLRSERHAQGCSLRGLATRAGISATYLGEIERGLKEPSFEVIEAVATALELSTAQMLRQLADRIEPPPATRALGYALRARGATVAVPALTSQLSQEDRYAVARFSEFLLRRHEGEATPDG